MACEDCPYLTDVVDEVVDIYSAAAYQIAKQKDYDKVSGEIGSFHDEVEETMTNMLESHGAHDCTGRQGDLCPIAGAEKKDIVSDYLLGMVFIEAEIRKKLQ